MNRTTTRKHASRKRMLWAVAGMALLPMVESYSVTTSLASARVRTAMSDEMIARQAPSLSRDPLYEDEDEEEDFDVSGYRRLRDSTGTEILESDLQRQIDEAEHPDLFLERYAQDASLLEKMAMSSVVEQLPMRAVAALNNKQEKKAEGKNNLNFAVGKRVSPEQEIQLARMIQEGARLQSIRGELVAKLGREPTRLKWAEEAGLSAKELRRRIAGYRSAKHVLVTANIGLVHAVVKQQFANYRKSGLSVEELVQEGSLGLLRAAELFDPSRGLRFSTYAVVWIKGTLSNSHVKELVKLPQREKTKWNKITKAQKDLEEMGEEVSIEVLSKMTALEPNEILATQRRMSQAKRVLSLDYEYATLSRSGTENSQLSVLEKDKALHADNDLAERTQMHADIIAAMARNLDAREGRLMRLRYGLSDGRPRSLHECADAMGLSYTRIHQLSNKCLKKLREAAEAKALEEYLLTVA